MFEKLLYLLSFYFLLGGIGLICIIRKNKGANSKLAITKYVSYIVVVFGMLFLIKYGFSKETVCVICVVGFYEVILAGWLIHSMSGST